jgi:hypothetical protein
VTGRIGRGLVAVIACCLIAAAPPAEQAALDRITPPALRTDVSYLASDELEGRMTPSRGLDLAADFIAARFRESGLEPTADGTYFQVAKFFRINVAQAGVQLKLDGNGEALDIPAVHLLVHSAAAIDIASEPVHRLPGSGAIPDVAGLIVAGEEYRWDDDTRRGELVARHPRLILLISGKAEVPKASNQGFLEAADTAPVPIIRIVDAAAARLLRSEREVTLSLHVPEPHTEPVVLRNVAGLLRGSDPVLSKQYVLLTAHYDHLGAGRRGIFHGANDDASGTASVMEIGAALAALPRHPARSILFMAFFGEEENLMGSAWYANHPLVPLKDSVADLNLEQMGRTDERTGREIGAYAITGVSYSSLPAILAEGAREEGVTTWRRRDADAYFDRSDNYSLAVHGVVAHTIAVAFEFPDYHAPGDTVDKIDFDNMAKVDRGIAAGLLRLANQSDPPRWEESRATEAWRAAASRRE